MGALGTRCQYVPVRIVACDDSDDDDRFELGEVVLTSASLTSEKKAADADSSGNKAGSSRS